MWSLVHRGFRYCPGFVAIVLSFSCACECVYGRGGRFQISCHPETFLSQRKALLGCNLARSPDVVTICFLSFSKKKWKLGNRKGVGWARNTSAVIAQSRRGFVKERGQGRPGSQRDQYTTERLRRLLEWHCKANHKQNTTGKKWFSWDSKSREIVY